MININLNDPVVASIAGALAGGVISLVLQVGIFFREKKLKKIDQIENFRASMIGLYWHIEEAHEFFERISDISKSALDVQRQESIPNLSLVFGVIYTNVEPVALSRKELYFLLRCKSIENFKPIKKFFGNFRILYDLSQEYRIKRERLLTILPGQVVNEQMIMGEMLQQDHEKAAPTIAHLDMMAKLIVENVGPALEEAKNASIAIREVLKNELGVDIVLRED